jgi:biopolymer transport protein ExbD
MKIPHRIQQGSLGFNMTPLIDMVFLLIIFFIVASIYVQKNTFQKVNLPSALTSRNEPTPGARMLTITVTSDGRYWINNEQLELNTVEAEVAAFASAMPNGQLNPTSIVIRGDIDTDFKNIKPLITACATHRIPYFSFATLQQGK